MKRTLIRKFRRRGINTPLDSQSGVTMALVAISMVAIIAIAALSIDLVTLFLAREEAQRAADAGALAGARVLSFAGLTGDTATSPTSTWACICGQSCATTGGAGFATLIAQRAAGQSTVSGVGDSPPSSTTFTATVTYSAAGGSSSDCTTLASPDAFGVNPMITVQVTRTSLPTFFSRLWGNTGNTVSATATAEAYNPSFSGSYANQGAAGSIIPVQPRCVKPLFVPNLDPLHPNGGTCHTANPPNACNPFLNSDGTIANRGVSLDGSGGAGVIGENFTLIPDCNRTHGFGRNCSLFTQPEANTGTNTNNGQPTQAINLDYLPGQAPSSTPVAVPSASSAGDLFEQAVAGCDQTTVYQCGIQSSSASTPNYVDLAENPSRRFGGGDVPNGLTALIHEATPASVNFNNGQDYFNNQNGNFGSTPFQIIAGSSNPMTGLVGSPISASNSIVTIPIYDSGATTTFTPDNTTPVTVVGFLQVFVNYVDDYGNINVTILNVAGCGNGSAGSPSSPVTGTSPVPIRLITPPTS